MIYNMKSKALCLLLGLTGSLAFKTAEEVLNRRRLGNLTKLNLEKLNVSEETTITEFSEDLPIEFLPEESEDPQTPETGLKLPNWVVTKEVTTGLAFFGGAMAVTGLGFTMDAMTRIGSTNGHENVLTRYGEGGQGNVYAGLIALAVVLGFSFIIFAGVTAMANGKNQHYMNTFVWVMTLCMFCGTSLMMLGINFMEQNAANSTDAFVNALTFSGDNGGTSMAEFGAGFAFYLCFILVGAMIVMALMFQFKKACFKARQL